MDRYTIVDLRNKVRQISEYAEGCGFPDTDRWAISRGSTHYNFHYQGIESDHPTVVVLGKTSKESWHRLDLFRRGLEAMRPLTEVNRQMKIMADGLRASTQMQSHAYMCNHCQLHVLGARPNWCDQYRHLLRKWRAGLDAAQTIHKQKYPVTDVLKYALSGY